MTEAAVQDERAHMLRNATLQRISGPSPPPLLLPSLFLDPITANCHAHRLLSSSGHQSQGWAIGCCSLWFLLQHQLQVVAEAPFQGLASF